MNLATVTSMADRRPEHLYPTRAERATIGIAITRGSLALSLLRELLREEDYTDPQSRVVFDALLSLDDAGRVRLSDGVNLIAILDALQRLGQAAQFPDGVEQLHRLFLYDEPAFGGQDGMLQAAKIVSRASRLRLAEQRAETLLRSIRSPLGLDDDLDSRVLLDSAACDLAEISSRALTDETTMSIAEVCDEHDRVMQARLDGGAQLMPYGITWLDEKTDGADCDEGELVMIAARPSMGKTAFFGAIVRGQNVRRCDYRSPQIRHPHHWRRLWTPVDNPRPVLIASAEMSEVKLLDRQCGDLCSIDTRRIQRPVRHGTPTVDDDREKWAPIAPLVADAKKFIRTWPVDYVTNPQVLEEIERQARAWHRALPIIGYDTKGKPLRGAAALIVDHLGCLRMLAGKPKDMSEANYVGMIVQRLKNLGKELKIVVYLLVQLNRGVEGRKGDDKVPQLSDMRDSGKIEEIADTVIMIHRPPYYGLGNESEDALWEQFDNLRDRGASERDILLVEGTASHMDALIRKARNGATGAVSLGFYRQYTRVTDKVRIYEAA